MVPTLVLRCFYLPKLKFEKLDVGSTLSVRRRERKFRRNGW